MRKLITAVATAAAILIAGSITWKAEATTVSGIGTLPPLTKSASPVEKVYCWCGGYRCACRYYGRPYYHRRYYRY
jgi:hypothetical protein